jgi:V/A-type H+-transporting ATPase subunit D
MELTRLKARLKTARRGHKLLKDKRDELMRQFLEIVRRNRELRARVDEGLSAAGRALTVASSIMSPDILEQSLLFPKQSVELDMTLGNIMSVRVPIYRYVTKNTDPSEIYPYGFAQTSGELDDALEAMAAVFADMLELAQVEKTMQLLADEIEKTRRRVNALEYVLIPEMQTTIRYISMKLEENELSTKVRLMKVKDMVLENARRSDVFHLTYKTGPPAARRPPVSFFSSHLSAFFPCACLRRGGRWRQGLIADAVLILQASAAAFLVDASVISKLLTCGVHTCARQSPGRIGQVIGCPNPCDIAVLLRRLWHMNTGFLTPSSPRYPPSGYTVLFLEHQHHFSNPQPIAGFHVRALLAIAFMLSDCLILQDLCFFNLQRRDYC